MFMETSALSGENVEEAFFKCTRTILAKIEAGKYELATHLNSFLIIKPWVEMLMS
jgi:hypothetical protein